METHDEVESESGVRRSVASDQVVHMLRCAKFFHNYVSEDTLQPLSSTFASETEARLVMKQALLFEAHDALSTKLSAPPTKILSNAIDLTTSPGIAIRTNQNSTSYECYRSNDDAEQVDYDVQAPSSDTPDDAGVLTDAQQQMHKTLTAKQLQGYQARALKAVEREHKKAEKRALELSMTKEEKSALVQQRKAERAEKRRQKEQDKDDDVAAMSRAADEEEEGECDELPDDDEHLPLRPQRRPQCPDEAESAVATDPFADSRKRSKARCVQKDSVTSSTSAARDFYASPAPHDRFLNGIVHSQLHPAIASTILKGVPHDNPRVRLIHGPPGCGKTTSLLELLKRTVEAEEHIPHLGRVLVCGPSNLCVANLYYKARFELNLEGCCLALAKEHIPIGVPKPRQVDVANARIVFATTAARAGRLHDQHFAAVFVDEAGLCPEPTMFGLFRRATQFACLVGDPYQLGGIVSVEGTRLLHNRSMLQRLMSIGVKTTQLAVQHRMHPHILEYPNAEFYENRLQTSQARLAAIAIDDASIHTRRFCVFAVRGQACPSTNESMENVEEAAQISKGVEEFFATHETFEKARDAVILTPYAGQAARLRTYQTSVPVYTIDSFQGREARVVFLSLVRTAHDTEHTTCAFWTKERMNVALTRARDVLHVFGDDRWADVAPEGVLGRLMTFAHLRGCLM